MAGKDVTGYSTMQVALHWIVVVLVAFQFLAHEGMEESWRAYSRGQTAPADSATLTYLHIAAGILVLLLALLRIYLRRTRGVPPPPPEEPRPLQIVASVVHVAIYVLLILMPLSGAVAWFGGVEAAAEAHEFMKNVLLGAIVLHVGGALFQHVVLRSQVLIRMFRPQRN